MCTTPCCLACVEGTARYTGTGVIHSHSHALKLCCRVHTTNYMQVACRSAIHTSLLVHNKAVVLRVPAGRLRQQKPLLKHVKNLYKPQHTNAVWLIQRCLQQAHQHCMMQLFTLASTRLTVPLLLPLGSCYVIPTLKTHAVSSAAGAHITHVRARLLLLAAKRRGRGLSTGGSAAARAPIWTSTKGVAAGLSTSRGTALRETTTEGVAAIATVGIAAIATVACRQARGERVKGVGRATAKVRGCSAEWGAQSHMSATGCSVLSTEQGQGGMQQGNQSRRNAVTLLLI